MPFLVSNPRTTKNKGSGCDGGNSRGLLCPLCAYPKPMGLHNFLYRHLEEEHAEVSHDCWQCGISMNGRYERARHIEKFHPKTQGPLPIKKRHRMKAVFKSRRNGLCFRIIKGTKGDFQQVGLDGQPVLEGIVYEFPYEDRATTNTPLLSVLGDIPSGWASPYIQSMGDQESWHIYESQSMSSLCFNRPLAFLMALESSMDYFHDTSGYDNTQIDPSQLNQMFAPSNIYGPEANIYDNVLEGGIEATPLNRTFHSFLSSEERAAP